MGNFEMKESSIVIFGFDEDQTRLESSMLNAAGIPREDMTILQKVEDGEGLIKSEKDPKLLLIDLRWDDSYMIDFIGHYKKVKPNVVVVVVTSDARGKVEEECKALGVEHFYLKPLGMSIMQSINEIATAHRE